MLTNRVGIQFGLCPFHTGMRFLALLRALFVWLDSLGKWCTSVYFAELFFVVCKTNVLLLPGIDHPTLLVMIIQAGGLK